MKASIYSRKAIEELMQTDFPENVAIISFYDPPTPFRDDTFVPIDYSNNDIIETDTDIFGHHISTILSVLLKEPLENWQNEADYLRHSLISITDYFLKKVSTVMQTKMFLNKEGYSV